MVLSVSGECKGQVLGCLPTSALLMCFLRKMCDNECIYTGIWFGSVGPYGIGFGALLVLRGQFNFRINFVLNALSV